MSISMKDRSSLPLLFNLSIFTDSAVLSLIKWFLEEAHCSDFD